MFRVDNASAVSPIPTPGAPGPNPDSFFGDGSTVLPADWLNAVQEELSNVVEDTGATLDKTDRTQLLTAIDQKITDATPTARLAEVIIDAGDIGSGAGAKSISGAFNVTSVSETNPSSNSSEYTITFSGNIGTDYMVLIDYEDPTVVAGTVTPIVKTRSTGSCVIHLLKHLAGTTQDIDLRVLCIDTSKL